MTVPVATLNDPAVLVWDASHHIIAGLSFEAADARTVTRLTQAASRVWTKARIQDNFADTTALSVLI